MLGAGEVLLRRWPCPHLPAQWFRVMDEEAAIVVGPCGHFFEADEYEMVRMPAGLIGEGRKETIRLGSLGEGVFVEVRTTPLKRAENTVLRQAGLIHVSC